jgi:hypothetical protein
VVERRHGLTSGRRRRPRRDAGRHAVRARRQSSVRSADGGARRIKGGTSTPSDTTAGPIKEIRLRALTQARA